MDIASLRIIGFLSAPVAFDCPKYVSGFSVVKATPFGLTYAKLLNLLGDPDEINQFKTFYRRPGHDLD